MAVQVELKRIIITENSEQQVIFLKEVAGQRAFQIVIGSTEGDGFARVEAEVPLAEMFGFSTVLRSATQGKAEFTMEFSRYAPLPSALAEELIKKHREEQAKKK